MMTPQARHGRGTSLVGAMLESRYRVDSLIARGGMSTVYRGLDTRLDRPVALKVMDARYSGDRSFVERFEREARSAAKLHHPDIVAVYDQGVDRSPDGDLVFLVMQLVEGCTLRDLILDRGGKLPTPMAVSVMRPVLSALTAAHQAGMVHRDVKPENVLIGTNGSVKVTDFGLVRAAAEAGTTSGSVILGTVAYLSPEQVATGAADARSDVYAAGILFYEMLTGTPPYTGDTALSVAYRHVNDDVPPPSEQVPGLAPAIDDLVVRATRREPGQRPADAQAFSEQLRKVCDDLGIKPVEVPVPASEERTALLASSPEPPTQQLPVTSSPPTLVAPQPPPPRRSPTRTMARPATGDDHAPPPPHAGLGDTSRGRRRAAMWTAIVLILVALVGGAAYWFGFGNSVEVPQVVGVQQADAEQALRGVGLTASVSTEHHNTVAEGVVISANPRPGSEIRSGRNVSLVVSLGQPRVPAISAGITPGEAEGLIRDAELKPRSDSHAAQYHPSIPSGRVIGVNPASGTRLNINSEVTIIVSKGPEPAEIPDVHGRSRDDAFTMLRNAGFDPYDAGQAFDSGVEAGHVVSTDPAIGSELLLTGRPKVGVVTSNAVTVPTITGTQLSDAQQVVAQLGLVLDAQVVFPRNGAVVLTQYPLPGSRVEPGSTIQATAL